MARPRTPSNILKLRGSDVTHPERARPNEPKPTRGIGAPPSWLSPEQAACFRGLVQAAYPGTLGAGDAFIVELGAVLLAELRSGASMTAAKMSRLHAVLGAMGLTPSDRSRISAAKARADGPGSFDF